MQVQQAGGSAARKKEPLLVDIYVGERMRTRRKQLGMSQEKLGQAIGLTFQQIQKYEKGTNRCGPSRLVVIANVLEVPITYFFRSEVTEREMPPEPDEARAKLLSLITDLRLALDGAEALLNTKHLTRAAG